MTEREKDIEKLNAMKEGDTIYLQMFQEGGVQVHKYNYEFLIYEIPLYGGTPRFDSCQPTAEKTFDTYEKWS